MRICILEADVPPDDLKQRHGLYSDMIRNWIAPDCPSATFSAVSCLDGTPLPDASGFDGFVITGSRYSAYDDHGWIADLKHFVRHVMGMGKPVFGICFGHQIMADAMGGKVGPSTHGWAVGILPYQPNEASTARLGPATLHAPTFHRDQIVTLPPTAEPLATSAHCTWPVVAYGDVGLSVQFHPEFSRAFVVDLLDHKEEIGLPGNVAKDARDSLVHDRSLDGLTTLVAALFAGKDDAVGRRAI